MPMKPSIKEQEYFARVELERRRKAEEEKQKKIARDEKKRLKELHYMCCPKCGMELQEIDYKNIKVDKCYGCEGMWFDEGEADLLSRLEKRKLIKLFEIFKT
jgi:uncharacterized protein YjhX (UPF0386 family)